MDRIKKCPNGHYYGDSLVECPYCRDLQKRTMERLGMVKISGGFITRRPLEPIKEWYSMPLDWGTYRLYIKDFYIMRNPVSRELYWDVIGIDDYVCQLESYPCTDINLVEIGRFISRLNGITGKEFRLPSVAEWEYAAMCREDDGVGIHSLAYYTEDHVCCANNSGAMGLGPEM